MRILQIHNFYQIPGGEDRVVEFERRLFEANGHEVIQYMRHNNDIKKYGFFQKIRFFAETVYSARTVKEINELINRARPDVAHVHNVFPLISPSVYYCLKRQGIPVIQTVHNYRFLCPNGLFYRNNAVCEKCRRGNMFHCFFYKCYKDSFLLSGLYALTLWIHRRLRVFQEKIDKFIVLSHFAKDKFVEDRFPKEKIEIKGNFLSEMEMNFDHNNKENYAVFMGRLSEEKGLMTLLKAFQKINKIKLKIIGKGHLEGGLKRYVSENNISCVEFLGYVQGNRRLAILQKARFNIIASKCYENFPMSALESFSMGIPVIASRIGGLSELIEDGKNGLLFEPGNAHDLTEKIEYLYKNPDKALEMGEYAHKCAEKKYNQEAHYSRLTSIYGSAIAGKKIIEILGLRVNLEDYESAIDKIEEQIQKKDPTVYVTLMSSNNLVNAQKDSYFKKISNSAFLALPDGMPLVWISRMKGGKVIKDRTCGRSLMYKFFEKTFQKNYRHFFYGGKEGVAEQLRVIFETKFPGVNIAGTYCPLFRKLNEEEDKEVCRAINSSGADIVWVGLGAPKQETWMHEHRDKLKASVLIGVGAAFDFHTGNLKQAPELMQKIGLEWFFRLLIEPRRLWKRYLIGNSLLIYWLARESFSVKTKIRKGEL